VKKLHSDGAYTQTELIQHVAFSYSHSSTKEALVNAIIAGRFQQQSEADDAMEELVRAGFARDRLASFFVNPAGQHATFPIGGDQALSPGAKESGKGVAAGAATGAAVGLAATAALGPVGAIGGLVGAHVGGLVGSLSEMKEKGDTGEHAEDAENATPPRKSGMMVAVALEEESAEERAISVLRSLGAADIERAQGILENGDWKDFNPVAPPTLVDFTPAQGPPQKPDRHA
jgi:hypothetical protein